MSTNELSLQQQFTLRKFNDEVLALTCPELRLLAIEMMVLQMKKDNEIADIMKKQLIGELPALSDMG
jgi:hypothetical protein